jgi:hypothetical protein
VVLRSPGYAQPHKADSESSNKESGDKRIAGLLERRYTQKRKPCLPKKNRDYQESLLKSKISLLSSRPSHERTEPLQITHRFKIQAPKIKHSALERDESRLEGPWR